MHDASRAESCPTCNSPGKRIYTRPYLSGTKVFEADYYPSLGKVFKTQRELKYHLDKHEIIDAGKEFDSPESIHKHFDKARADKHKKSWDELDI